MGAGHDKKVLTKGVQHNDFEPFITIGETWGDEILPGTLKSRNKWTVVGK